MKILITGGTGFIGSSLIDYLINKNHEIIILNRFNKKSIHNGVTSIKNLDQINNSKKIDAIINLAGANIGKRWSQSYKNELITSRIATTNQIILLIKRLDHKPKVLISASAIGYYGNPKVEFCDEETKARDCFTHNLCYQWEQAALLAKNLEIRTCIMRLGVVLGNGGALNKMILPFKLYLGGVIGTGEQYFNWVHIKDVVNIIDIFLRDDNFDGIFNITTPTKTTNKEFTKTLGAILNRPTLVNLPSFVIRLLLGEMGEELLLKGTLVLPKKLESLGYNFLYSNLNIALSETLRDRI